MKLVLFKSIMKLDVPFSILNRLEEVSFKYLKVFKLFTDVGARVEIISNLLRTVVNSPNLYRIPKIQRSFVWNWDKVKNLFESLYRGYPVGILVFWKTSEYIPSDPIVGIDEEQKESDVRDYYYILDGNQRLTSLILAVSN